jgi:hypothetical protein
VLWFCHDFDVYLIYLEENTFVKGEKLFSERKLIKILKSRREKVLFLVLLLWGGKERRGKTLVLQAAAYEADFH